MLKRYGWNILRRNPPAGHYEIMMDVHDLRLSLVLRPAKKPLDFGRVAVGWNRVDRLYAVPRGDVAAQRHYQGKDDRAPQQDISRSLTPIFDGQEVTMLGLSYWLARCEVVGNVAGRSVGGGECIPVRQGRGAPCEE